MLRNAQAAAVDGRIQTRSVASKVDCGTPAYY